MYHLIWPVALQKEYEKDFSRYHDRIKKILVQYIAMCKQNKKNGWQKEAQEFLDGFDPSRQNYSLFILKERLHEFSETLRSSANRWASYIVNDAWMKSLGSGSTLKESIDLIVNEIDPLAAKYVIDDIYVTMRIKEREILAAGESINFYLQCPCDFLSAHSRQALQEIVLDEDKLARFYQQANEASLRGSRCLFPSENIINSFLKVYQSEVQVDVGPEAMQMKKKYTI